MGAVELLPLLLLLTGTDVLDCACAEGGGNELPPDRRDEFRAVAAAMMEVGEEGEERWWG